MTYTAISPPPALTAGSSALGQVPGMEVKAPPPTSESSKASQKPVPSAAPSANPAPETSSAPAQKPAPSAAPSATPTLEASSVASQKPAPSIAPLANPVPEARPCTDIVPPGIYSCSQQKVHACLKTICGLQDACQRGTGPGLHVKELQHIRYYSAVLLPQTAACSHHRF
jgi:hypothetical protein